MTALTPVDRNERRRLRRRQETIRWSIRVLVIVLVFALGVALGQAIQDNPRIVRYLFNLGRAHQKLALQPSTDTAARIAALRRARLAYEDATQRGYVSALNDLATLYENGERGDGVGSDDAKASELLKRAAQQGHPLAMYNLALRYRDGTHGEADLLASCYRRALEVADELGARSVAFPAISTGIYGFPRGQAARIAVETVRATETGVGEYTGRKTVGGVVLTFAGCERLGEPCTSAGSTSGEIVTSALEGMVGIEKLGATAKEFGHG